MCRPRAVTSPPSRDAARRARRRPRWAGCSASSSSASSEPWLSAAHAAALVGEIDLVAVPAQLPDHGDDHDARALGQRPHGDDGGPSERATPADRARVVGCVEQLERPLHLELGVGRDRADVARLARRAGSGAGVGGLASGVGVQAPDRRRGSGGGSAELGVGALAGALAPPAQPPDPRARAALLAGRAQLQLVGAVLADPALVLRARRCTARTPGGARRRRGTARRAPRAAACDRRRRRRRPAGWCGCPSGHGSRG